MEGFMSGDMGLDETIIFYSEEMTQAKLIVLKYKGIKLEYKSLKEIFDAKLPKFQNFWERECREHPTNQSCLIYCDWVINFEFF